LNINDLKTIDDTVLSLNIFLEKDNSYSKEMAVGASILGIVVLNNPIGLIAGYFVQGQEQVLAAETELKVSTIKEETVIGIDISN
jgi:hypothetical protein